MIDSIKHQFGNKYVYGLSDHTMQVETPSFAFMLGATVVEKHYTVDKTLGKSADHWLSVDPGQVRKIVDLMAMAHLMKGTSDKKSCTESEERARLYARRSVVSLRDIKKGEEFTKKNIGCKRPGTGISPIYYDSILGKSAMTNIDEDNILEKSNVSGGLLNE
jgi:sialic acid synthase SpsE